MNKTQHQLVTQCLTTSANTSKFHEELVVSLIILTTSDHLMLQENFNEVHKWSNK